MRKQPCRFFAKAIASGVNHIDTSDFYGPHITNRIINRASHPYPKELTLVTKVGARRGGDGSWIQDTTPASLESSIHDNLRNLGLDALPIVNLRVGGMSSPDEKSIAEPLGTLVELQRKGLIQHIGLSNISQKQFEEARPIAKIVCIQNYYNVAHRENESFLNSLIAEGIPYVPFFPLGGFTPLQSSTLTESAAALNVTPMVVALAWLLQHAPNILLIPGTSSVEHLRENLSAATLRIPEQVLGNLDNLAQEA